MNIAGVRAFASERALWFCDRFINGDRPKYLFGRNKYALSVAKHVDVVGYIDDFTGETSFHGCPIIKLEALPADAQVVNCVAVGRPLTAQRRIDAFGYDQLDYYAFLKHSGLALEPIDYWVGFEAHFEQAADRYADLYASLADPMSREVLARLVNFRLDYDLDHMRIFSDTQRRQYFEHFLPWRDREVFADIGAFDGVTSEEFARRRPDYHAIYVFEPNPRNLEVARERLNGDARVRFVPAAVGARAGTARFDAAGSSSRISEHGGVEVRVETLDRHADAGFTFLKMDIEGAESQAIAGAETVIRTLHPKMAISVYHNPSDLVDIPAQVLSIRPDYELRLRHYTEGFTETVMYFIPKQAL